MHTKSLVHAKKNPPRISPYSVLLATSKKYVNSTHISRFIVLKIPCVFCISNSGYALVMFMALSFLKIPSNQ